MARVHDDVTQPGGTCVAVHVLRLKVEARTRELSFDAGSPQDIRERPAVERGIAEKVNDDYAHLTKC